MSWRQSNARTIKIMHLGVQFRKSGKRENDLLLFMYVFAKRHAQTLSYKVEVEDDKLQLSIQNNGKIIILQFLSNMKGVYTRMNRCKILKDKGWL